MDRPAPTEHPIHPLLASRWSPRAFAPRPIAPDQFARLMEAARWAPSCFNEQPWAFLVATPDDEASFARMLECLVEFNRTWASAAPLLMLTVAHENFSRNGKPNVHARHDVGLAVANLTVQATSEGLAVHQMAGILPDRIRQTYSVPDDWSPVTAVAVGYPGDPKSLPEALRDRELAPRERRPSSSFVFQGAWGSPWKPT